MNEDKQKFVYGYNNGWNVENEYIYKINKIAEEYENQKNVLKRINSEKQVDKLTKYRFNSLGEEELKKTYEEFYSDSRISFEQFKRDYMLEKEKSEERIDKRILQNQIKYNANLYYLIDIKESLQKQINEEKNNLEYKLKQNELDIKQQLLYFSSSIEKEDINPREKLDDLYLENSRLKHAISELNQRSQEIQLTNEESELRLKGLNPQESLLYNELKRTEVDDKLDFEEISKTYTKEKEEIPVKSFDTSEKVEELPEEFEEKEKDTEHEKYVFDEKLYEDYETKLEEYHNELKEYEQDCTKISMMYEQILNDEISLSEFETFESEMEQRQVDINKKYNSFVEYRNQVLEKVKNKEIYHPSLKKEECRTIVEEFGIIKPEGDQYEEYLEDMGLSNDYINEPRKPLDFHEILNEIAEKYDEKTKDDEIEDIFEKIKGNYDPSKGLTFADKLIEVKLLNEKKFKQRKIADIPMKLYRGVLGISANLLNLASNITPKSRQNVEGIFDRIDKLTKEELEIIYERLNNLYVSDEYKTNIPDVAWDKLLERIFENNEVLVEKNIKSITTMYDVLLDIYNEMTTTYSEINSGELAEDEKKQLKENFLKNEDDALELLRRMNSCYSQVDKLLNPKIQSDYLRGKWNKITDKRAASYLKNIDKLNEFNEKIEEKIDKAIDTNDFMKTIEYIVYKERINIDFFVKDEEKDFLNKETNIYEDTREEYLQQLEEWQSRGPLYRLIHRNQKPNEIDIALNSLEGRVR